MLQRAYSSAPALATYVPYLREQIRIQGRWPVYQSHKYLSLLADELIQILPRHPTSGRYTITSGRYANTTGPHTIEIDEKKGMHGDLDWLYIRVCSPTVAGIPKAIIRLSATPTGIDRTVWIPISMAEDVFNDKEHHTYPPYSSAEGLLAYIQDELIPRLDELLEQPSSLHYHRNPTIQCPDCGESKPQYQYGLCYLCYRKNQCRWLDDIDLWVDTMEKPQCSRLMYKMGFCKKHWRTLQQKERERENRDNPRAYHRSPIRGITSFDSDKMRFGDYGPGFYFAEEHEGVQYAGQHLYTADLDINSPLDVENATPEEVDKLGRALRIDSDYILSNSPTPPAIQIFGLAQTLWDTGMGYKPQSVIKVLKALGYDGIVVKSKGYWVAFDPDQIVLV